MDYSEQITNLLNKMCLLYDNEIKKIINKVEQMKINSNSKILLSSAYHSIENSKLLLDNNSFVDSMSLLRSAFETMLLAIAINVDNYCRENYIYLKEVKFSDGKSAKKKKQLLTAGCVRDVISINLKDTFPLIFDSEEDCKTYLTDFYQLLCNFTHPTVFKLFYEKIRGEDSTTNGIKKILLINIYEVMMLFCAFYYYKSNQTKKIDAFNCLNSYMIIFNLSSITNSNIIIDIFKKYKKYLYLNKNSDYMKKAKQDLKEIKNLYKDNIKEIDKTFIMETFEKALITLEIDGSTLL